eukprot:TRINITY_DN275_c0_g1_i3.p1 TRINITY_DN275_c0_g1~~TRINITY_DN275_c0_g1_i3.p1  ORF type:complete len:358 (+),score=80.58 TRINITY_DN275_c0_g1_i3:111-1184(+)
MQEQQNSNTDPQPLDMDLLGDTHPINNQPINPCQNGEFPAEIQQVPPQTQPQSNGVEWVDNFIKLIKEIRGPKLDILKKGFLDICIKIPDMANYVVSVVNQSNQSSNGKDATSKKKICDPTLKEMEPKTMLQKLIEFYNDFKQHKKDLLQEYQDGLNINQIQPWDIEKPESIEQYRNLLPEIKLMKERDFSNMKHGYLFEFLQWVSIGQAADVMFNYYKKEKEKEFKGKTKDMFVLETFGSQFGPRYFSDKRSCYLLTLQFPSILYLFMNTSVEMYTPTDILRIAGKLRKFLKDNKEKFRHSFKDADRDIPEVIWNALPQIICENYNFNKGDDQINDSLNDISISDSTPTNENNIEI